MIVKAIFALFKLVVGALKLLLPSWTPVDFGGMATTVVGGIPPGVASWLRWSNYYLPSVEIFGAIGILATLYVARHLYEAIIYVLTKIHILGGAS